MMGRKLRQRHAKLGGEVFGVQGLGVSQSQGFIVAV